MALGTLLSSLPWGWRIALGAVGVLVVGGAYGAGMKRGFDAGHEAASARGEAALAALEREYALRYAEARAIQAARLREETEKAMRAASALTRAKEEHAKTEQSLRARVAVVTRDSVHRFSPGFVRLFNEAVGAAAGDSGGGQPGAAGTSATAGAGPAAGAGVHMVGASSPGSVMAEPGVTERDVLAYIVYFGRRSRDMEAQLQALVRLVREKGGGE